MSHRLVPGLAVTAIAIFAGGIAADAATSGKLTATLSGSKEIGGGAPGGKGTFSATFKSGQVCYTLKFSKLPSPVAAHIHKGTAKQNGNIVVDLKPKFAVGKAAAKCVPIKASLATAIQKKASGYYVNIHTQKFPAGAARGQLTFK
jgi:hypothetical protein